MPQPTSDAFPALSPAFPRGRPAPPRISRRFGPPPVAHGLLRSDPEGRRAMLIPTFASLIAVALASAQSASPDEAVLSGFQNRVAAYVALHRQLEGPLPTLEVSDDPERIHLAMDALAGEIRRVRWNAKQGDIVTPDVAAALRRTIGAALAEHPELDVLYVIFDEYPPGLKIRPIVNARFPAVVGPGMMPSCILWALPELPEELQYRFVGRDLVLWDVHANLIVDIVPDAVPVALTN
jgi:hypothetical protein